MHSRFGSRASKMCALVAAAVALPLLAYGQDNLNEDGHHKHHKKDPPAVPEVNPAWVLVPVFGAILLYSYRRGSRA
jgi:hypothetical protein